MPRAAKHKFGARAGKRIFLARAVKYKYGARASKHKLGARAGRYKLGIRAVKYKLGARAGAQDQDQGPSKELGAGKYKYPILTGFEMNCLLIITIQKNPANIYLFKLSSRNVRYSCGISSNYQ